MFFTILGIGITCATAVVSYKLSLHRVIHRHVTDKMERWRSLNNLVATRHDNRLMVFLMSVQLLLKAMYLSFIQYLNNSVRKLDSNLYEVSYTINGRVYKMLVEPIKGPTPVLQIISDNSEDVTDIIMPYLGPRYDWHRSMISPNFFDQCSLTFELMDGSSHTYQGDDHFKPKHHRSRI